VSLKIRATLRRLGTGEVEIEIKDEDVALLKKAVEPTFTRQQIDTLKRALKPRLNKLNPPFKVV